AAAEPALVRLLPRVHVAAAAAHRVEAVAVLAARAAVRIIGERRGAALQRRRVLHAEVVPWLLHEHDAADGRVVPGVVRWALWIADRRQPRPVTGAVVAAVIPEVVVERPALRVDHRFERTRHGARVATVRRVRDGPDHDVADVLAAV